VEYGVDTNSRRRGRRLLRRDELRYYTTRSFRRVFSGRAATVVPSRSQLCGTLLVSTTHTRARTVRRVV